MDLNFSKEDLAFRDEVRAFLDNEYPKHIKEKMHNGDELTREEVVEWHKCVAKKGCCLLYTSDAADEEDV